MSKKLLVVAVTVVGLLLGGCASSEYAGGSETTRTPVTPTNRFPCLVPEPPSKAPPPSRSFSVLPLHPVSIKNKESAHESRI